MLRLLALFVRTFFETLRSRLARGPLLPSWSFGFEATVRFLRNDGVGMMGWPYAKVRADLDRRPIPKDAVQRVTREGCSIGGVPGTSSSRNEHQVEA